MQKKYKACSQDVLKSCLIGVESVNATEWICITCDSNLKKGNLPSCSKANKMGFPDKPDALNLTSLEERLISPRIPFMQICGLPRGGQLLVIVKKSSPKNLSANCRSTVGRQLTDRLPTVYRQLTNRLPTG